MKDGKETNEAGPGRIFSKQCTAIRIFPVYFSVNLQRLQYEIAKRL